MTEQERQAVTALRKLTEDTINDLEKVITQRDEARAKLAGTEAHCAMLREALEEVKPHVPCPCPLSYGKPHSDFLNCPLRSVQRALESTPADSLKEIRNKFRLEFLAWMQKPVTEMEISDPAAYLTVSAFIDKVRQRAGRDRAVQELDGLIEKTKRFGHSVTLAASTQPWDFSSKTEQALLMTFIEQRRDEIAKEGK